MQRIESKQALVRVLFSSEFDFTRALADPAWFRTAGRDPFAILGMVGQDWNCCLFDSVSDATIEGKAVLIRS